jgi:hypothetical protein
MNRLASLLLCCVGSVALAQEPDRTALRARFEPGHRLLGAGLTGAGLHLKTGKFFLPGFWLGGVVQTQFVGAFSRHAQAGLAGRYYVHRSGDFTYFFEGAYAYGRFRTFQNRTVTIGDAVAVTDQPYWSGNAQMGAGVDLRITEQISLEGAVRRHHVLESGAAFPGISLGANYFF